MSSTPWYIGFPLWLLSACLSLIVWTKGKVLAGAPVALGPSFPFILVLSFLPKLIATYLGTSLLQYYIWVIIFHGEDGASYN